MMGTGEADGEGRALRAAELAISNPLLDDTSMAGARGLLINITGGDDMTLFEVDEAANRIRQEVDEDANIIFGSSTDESLEGRIRVSVVATGMESAQKVAERPHLIAVGGGSVMPMAQAVAQHQTAQHQVAQAQQTAPNPGTVATPGLSAQPAMMPAARPNLARAPLPVSRPLPHATGLQPGMRPQPQPIPQQRPVEQRFERLPEAAPAYESELDEAAPPARQIPPHLQQPLRPQAAPRATPRVAETRPAASKSGLFNEAPRNDAPAAPRKSLFGIVTGAIRGHHGHTEAAAHEAPAGDPGYAEPARDRAPSRTSGSEEMGIEIPAFLRRQS
jgi:cell division protein FtsZ